VWRLYSRKVGLHQRQSATSMGASRCCLCHFETGENRHLEVACVTSKLREAGVGSRRYRQDGGFTICRPGFGQRVLVRFSDNSQKEETCGCTYAAR
jgi:hypothetical protein